jgi:hypothetical protein
MSDSGPATPAEPRPRGGRRPRGVRRTDTPGRWIALGVAIAIVLGFAGILLLPQTQWGRSQVLAYTLRALGGRFDGILTIQRLEGSLITGARLYELALTDRDGVPLALVDSAHIQYRIATFIGGDVVITRLILWDAQIQLLRMPGDTLWNYQEILRDPTPDPTVDPADAAATLIERLRLENTRVTIRGPLEPDPRLSPARWEEELRQILADTARFEVEEVPGGYLRTQWIDIAEANLAELYIGPDERGGIYLEVHDALADVRLWRDPPLELRSLRARLHLREGVVAYQATEVVLPNTWAESVGRVDLRGDRPMYDVYVTTPGFVLADLRWLYPWLPDDPAAGGGSLRLRVEDRPDELLVLARDLVLEMPGTHVTGQFGVLVAPERLRFVDVDLEAEPLDVDSVEQLFPADLAVEGLRIGGAVIRGES